MCEKAGNKGQKTSLETQGLTLAVPIPHIHLPQTKEVVKWVKVKVKGMSKNSP